MTMISGRRGRSTSCSRPGRFWGRGGSHSGRREKGYSISRKRVQRLMRKMGTAALGPKPRTSKPAPGHKTFPYLLRNLAIDRPNQVWAITAIQTRCCDTGAPSR